jgi:CHAT domain-containing protein
MKNLIPYPLLLIAFISFASFHAFGAHQAVKAANSIRLTLDTTGLRQLIDSTEWLVDDRMFAEAQLLLDQILPISERELGRGSRETADILHQMARIQNFKNNTEAAIMLNREALAIRQVLFGERSAAAALSLESLGINYYFAGQYFEALPFFQTELDIWETQPEPDPSEIATALNLLALTYDAIGDYERSMNLKEKTLRMRLEFLGDEHPLIGAAYNNLGIHFDRLGDHDQAIAHKLKGLAIIEKAVGKDHEFYATSAANIGVSYYEKADYDNAIRWTEIGLERQKKIFGDSNYNTIASYNNLAGCYDGKKEYATAIQLKKDALSLALASYKEGHVQTAGIYNNIGFSFLMNTQPDSALVYVSKSIESYLEVFDHEHPDMIPTFRTSAMSHAQKHDFDQALFYIRKATALAETIQYGNQTNLAYCYESFGDILRRQYESEVSIGLLENACEQYAKAFALYREQLLKGSNGSKKDLAKSISFLGDKLIPMKLRLMNQSPNNRHKNSLFDVAEQSKALILFQSIRENQVMNFAGLDSALREKNRDVKTKINYYENKMRELQLRQVADDNPQSLAISTALFDLNREYELIKQQIRAENPAFFNMVFDLKTIPLQDIQSLLSANDEALLEYFVGDSSIFLFLIKSDDYQVVEVKTNDSIERLIQQLRTGLYTYHTSGNKPDTLLQYTTHLYTDAAQQLYDLLLAPVQALLPKRLIIVPDGVLGYIPFEALLMERPAGRLSNFHSHRYFGKEHIISYAYSASLLREMRGKQHSKIPSGSVLAMAPFFHGDTKKIAQSINPAAPLLESVARGDSLKTLTYSGEEALRIAKAYKGNALLEAQATKAAFLEQAADYRYLHLSTHGVADDRVGDYAYLSFCLPGQKHLDEKLYVRDIYNLSLNADLVVLSACEAGIGPLQRGEGIISLSRAFAYAGAKGIVTTLWSVNDESTKDFMLAFYGHLQKMSAAEALWQTRRDFLGKRKGEQAHPYYWAGFIGIGDM